MGAQPQESPPTGESPEADEHSVDERHAAERGAESYGGDPDAEPTTAAEEAQAADERDQAEG